MKQTTLHGLGLCLPAYREQLAAMLQNINPGEAKGLIALPGLALAWTQGAVAIWLRPLKDIKPWR